jgi:hypothetical protein
MTKTEILTDLELSLNVANSIDNVYLRNKLMKVKESLVSLWDKEDMYYEEIRNVLQMDETFDNLNQLKIR